MTDDERTENLLHAFYSMSIKEVTAVIFKFVFHHDNGQIAKLIRYDEGEINSFVVTATDKFRTAYIGAIDRRTQSLKPDLTKIEEGLQSNTEIEQLIGLYAEKNLNGRFIQAIEFLVLCTNGLVDDDKIWEILHVPRPADRILPPPPPGPSGLQ